MFPFPYVNIGKYKRLVYYGMMNVAHKYAHLHSLLSPDKASCISINTYTQVCVSVIHRFGFYDRVIKFARFPTYAGVSTRKCIEALVKDCVLTGIIEYKYYVCHAIHVLYV